MFDTTAIRLYTETLPCSENDLHWIGN